MINNIKMFILCLTLTALPVQAMDALVIKVKDGDTLVVETARQREITVRIYGIDAPEMKQSYGKESKNTLEGLCLNASAKIEIMGADRYGRVIGLVCCNGVDAAAYLLSGGFAWVYEDYLDDEKMFEAYLESQRFAQEYEQGLWQDENSIPPWKWRRH